MVNITVNGLPLEVAKGTTLLKAAKLVGIKIPTLCYHADLPAWAACGICVVKVEGSPKLFRACATQVQDGMKIITHDPELYEIRRTVIQLIMSTHPNDCLSCPRNGNCELQTLAADFGIRDVPFEHRVPEIPLDDSTPSIILNPEKCIKCGRCVNVCQQMQDVWALEFIGRGDGTRMAGAGDVLLNETPCIKCGQCSAHCPVGAIYEKDETRTLMRAIRDPEKHVAVQIAPAVRVAIGEAFGMAPGTISTGKIYAALRMMGVDAVFDTNFSADLTIMEEGTELVKRLTEGGTLPQITSCCPAWTDYMEKYFPDMIPHFSTAKSPMMMQGAITKTYYADRAGIKPENIFSAAIMPCTAKKFEITRCEKMYSSGQQDVDLVLTTRELARLIKALGIDFNSLPDEAADSPIGRYSGAGTIFGNTGGVMEAAIRTAYNLVTGKELEDVKVNAVRGMEGVRRGEVDIDGTKVRVAVAHGMANVRDVMREIQEAREKGKEPPYHFIEVMACRGGCIAGGGQPYNTTDDVREKRIAGMYADDEKSVIRCSHQNPEIKQIYKEFLGKPLSKKAHELLHTNYTPRPLYRK
ncbi:NADH-dependent [FeFe] hydrogenase, group A6 [Marispirochaeta aestuarii]|uniref:NADH-dependent [FeFe] hydrogenase, group A6 n=1 Tax=Marispirochaeta aestuarii TaxID=1963862 RepID=UPI0029C822FC|nr:NADH-dependent [FeFe] hydrogenase, group A6 [Marispirochaeta aestuarii]